MNNVPAAISPRTIQFNLNYAQSSVFNDPARHKVVVTGRRFGKTFVLLLILFVRAVNQSGSLCWYIAPTVRMAHDIAWDTLKRMVPREYLESKPNETYLSMRLRNGSEIILHGSDNPDSLRGPGLDMAGLDEASYIKREVWPLVVRPMLADKEGGSIHAGTPGVGYDHFYDLAEEAKKREGWSLHTYTTLDGGRVRPEEIEQAKTELDEKSFAREFLARFGSLEGNVYYSFDRLVNLKPFPLAMDQVGEIEVGIDFNVDPGMHAAIGHRIVDQCWQFDEVVIPSGNTFELVQEIQRRYPGKKVICYPDPSGVARKTSAPAGQTDFTILRNAGFQVVAPHQAPPIIDRINTVNGMMKNTLGISRYYIDPRCHITIKCFERLKYKEGTRIPDQTSQYIHMTDAVGYWHWSGYHKRSAITTYNL